jgi:hypothetical protein
MSDTIAIMQPYIFPYIGYYQLLHSVDKFIFLDDVNYFKKGYINRNNILLKNEKYLLTFPLTNVSQNVKINQIKLNNFNFYKKHFFKTIQCAYGKAPYYKQIIELLNGILFEKKTLLELSSYSIIEIFKFLNLNKKYDFSSINSPETFGQEKSLRLINISKKNNCNVYHNAIGGQKIYSKECFKKYGVDLFFVKNKHNCYKQFNNNFIPNLSIIDILMFNSKEEVVEMLGNYEKI